MASYVSLDEAAKLLGMTANELIEMRSRGEIFGFRDGSSWKFKSDEIDRVRQELSGDVLDDDAGGSSILVSERSGGSSKSGIFSGTGSGEAKKSPAGSDINLGDEGLELGSDVALVPDPSSGSGLRLVNKSTKASNDSDLQIGLDDELELDASSISLGDEKLDDLGMGSELKLADEHSPPAKPSKTPPPAASDDSDILGGSDLKLQSPAQGGSPDLILDGSDHDLDLGDEMKLSPDKDDDLVLSSNSDLALSGESGINLMTPSDSGISLEDEVPLDLDGAGISGLELGSSAGSGSDVDIGNLGSDAEGGSGSGAGISGIDFGSAGGEDFQLSPSGGFEVDEDSGSQVIEVEDSADLGGFPNEAFGNADGGLVDDGLMAGAPAGAAATGYSAAPEIPLANWEVFTLLTIVLMLGVSGLLVTDIVRNMWAWSETDSSITSWFTKMIISSVRMEG